MVKTRGILIGLLVCLLAGPASAAKVALFAEAAEFPTGTSDCTKVANQGTNDAYVSVNCTDAGANGKKFALRGAIVPPGANASGVTTKITYYTPDTGTNKQCVWQVTILSVIDGTTEDLVGTQAHLVSATNTHSATKEYIATSSGTLTVQKDNGSGAAINCTTSECNDKEARVVVTLNAGLTDATSCRLTSLILDFPN